MDEVKVLMFAVLFLCWTSQVLSQCGCNSKRFCSSAGKDEFAVLVQGVPGAEGMPGAPGQKGQKGHRGRVGFPGPFGPKGEPSKNVDLQSEFTKCGMYSTSWRRVAHIDMTDPAAQCPSGLHEFNVTHNTRACGVNDSADSNGDCTNHTFTTGWSYTHVCGRVRGYHSVITGNLGAFYPGTINDRYADGVLITSEIPRRHLWTYAVGTPRKRNYSLCTNESRLPVLTGIPGFVRNDSYCEDRPTNTTTIAWQDPLWTKKHGCIANNTSCLGYGWFHKKVNHTSDSIEVRWCTREGAVYTDIVEIWVL